MDLYLDTEVAAPFRNALNTQGGVGLDNYARHQNTRILLFSYAIGDGPAQLWDCYHALTQPPADLLAALKSDAVQLVAHNAMFDRVVLKHQLGFNPPLARWYCTAAQARIHGLPGDLDSLSRIYKLGDQGKQGARGKELIQLFCEQRADPGTHTVEWLEFCNYALHDVIAMRELHKRMPSWSFDDFEQRLYHLDQQINDLGFCVDLSLAECMIDASDEAKASLDLRVQRLTDGAIMKGTQREKIKTWLDVVPDMRAETLRKTLRDADSGRVELSAERREMIELRLLSAKSSIAKCATALRTAGPDGRVRYAMTYAGAGRIGRFSHKGFQPGNMPRPSKVREEPEQQLAVIEALQNGSAITIWGDETMSACADAIRGLIVAAPGHKLISVDWSNIEGRCLAWYANEGWKLQAYRDQDAGTGEDGYKLTFHRMTGKPIAEITGFLRQQGKGADLSMGYEGGVGAFCNVANSYQLDLVELSETAPNQLNSEQLERGEKEWNWTRSQDPDDSFDDEDERALAKGLPRKIFVACSALKYAWRDAHPNIVALWRNLLACAKTAVSRPGQMFECAGGKVKMACDTNLDWLAVLIPSGRQIMFAKPRIRQKVTLDRNGKERVSEELTAMKSPGWYRRPLYGGLIANAVTQGGCRDILGNRMLAVAEAGFPIILHVHDDIISEVPENDPLLTIERQTKIMLDLPVGFEGLPLSASGFETKRLYKG